MAKMADIFGFYNFDSAISYAKTHCNLPKIQIFIYGEYLAYRNLFFAYNVPGDIHENARSNA